MNGFKKHGFFCRCDSCKYKRIHSWWYLGLLAAITISIFYQAILLLFITTRLNAFFLFILLVFLTIGIARMII
mgnify:CR=1 FL=1